MKRAVFIALALLAAFGTPAFGQAPGYPNRPVKIVVPFSPGTAADMSAASSARGCPTCGAKAW
jgi:tripartite-type tricarboxylate transporter receptor subunit TctC